MCPIPVLKGSIERINNVVDPEMALDLEKPHKMMKPTERIEQNEDWRSKDNKDEDNNSQRTISSM